MAFKNKPQVYKHKKPEKNSVFDGDDDLIIHQKLYEVNNPRINKRGKLREYYVSPKELKEEVIKYIKSGDSVETRTISNRLGEMIMLIAKHYATKPNFSGYFFKNEFISNAVYYMCKNLSKININLPNCNPFSYLTAITYCSFISTIKKYKKELKNIQELREKIYSDFCQAEGLVGIKNRKSIYSFAEEVIKETDEADSYKEDSKSNLDFKDDSD